MDAKDGDAESDGAPEAMSLATGRDVFFGRRRIEQQSRKKKAAMGGGGHLDAGTDGGSAEARSGGKAESGQGAEDLARNQLPEEIVQMVVARADRAAQRRGSNERPTLLGTSKPGGTKRKRATLTEIHKGPVIVKVLYDDAPPKATESAMAFRTQWLNRHRRTVDMLREPKWLQSHPAS